MNRAPAAAAGLTPREIVSELDRHIVGQADAKRAVAVALRNRWRRQQLPEPLRSEVTPKNILMIGPTGVGKTEISRRLARLVGAPFLKVEATKFTEVGYVGRDVDQIIRDLVEVALQLVRTRRRAEVSVRAAAAAEDRVIEALVGTTAGPATRESFRRRLRAGELDDSEVELDLPEPGRAPGAMFELPGMAGQTPGMANIGELLGKAFGQQRRRRKLKIREAHEPLLAEESDKLLDEADMTREAVSLVENDGIVFIDEIDKVARHGERSGADVSREGVQRDLLPLIEGSVIATKYGPVRTDHILFIASGAFHIAKPSDLLPELQGRLPIRVELKPLGVAEFRAILTDTEASLLKQYVALLQTEGVTLRFTEDGIDRLAETAAEVNASVENIGARRLATILERVLEEIAFSAADRDGATIDIDRAYVDMRLAGLSGRADLARYIL